LDDGHIASSAARFLQYKIEIQSGSNEPKVEPAIDGVTWFYQTRNQPPSFNRIVIHSPNIELIRMIRSEGSLPTINPTQSSSSASSNSQRPAGEQTGDSNASRPPSLQQNRRLGYRSATWQASDPNGDELLYSVYYRMAGSTEWKLLKEDLTDPFVAWDAAAWKDGEYYLKIVASDLPKNLEGDERTDEIISNVFTVDQIPPTIQFDLKTMKDGFISIKISDSVSIVDEAQYSVDGAKWKALLPVSGLYDSRSNEFHIPVESFSEGEHYINLRASDSADNISSVTINFKK
jgi:hypothetical protein